MDKLENKVIWLTGASSGIGAALAESLAERRNTVYVSARRAEPLEALQKAHPDYIVPVVADVVNEDRLKEVAALIQERHGFLDLVIANAGTCEYVDVKSIDIDMVKRVMDANYIGAVQTIVSALPLLREAAKLDRKATISFMSSSSTYVAFPRAEAYGASKAALNYFAESLRVDLAGEGIDVNIISPGFVATPLTDQNDFDMPFCVDTDRASSEIIEGLERGKPEIHFPKRFTVTLKLLGSLPHSLKFLLTKGLSRNLEVPN